MKFRKPRFSPKRIESAEQFLKVADRFIQDGLDIETPNQNEVARNTEYKKNRKTLSIGKEFLLDLVSWQRSQLQKEK